MATNPTKDDPIHIRVSAVTGKLLAGSPVTISGADAGGESYELETYQREFHIGDVIAFWVDASGELTIEKA